MTQGRPAGRTRSWAGRWTSGRLAGLLLLVTACQATTTRPTFSPAPGALTAQLRLDPPEALETVLAAFRADSIPLQRVETRDGYFDSGWLVSPQLTPAEGRPVGPGYVRVRGWVDLGKPYHSRYTVETVYRVYLDPSREDRELEAPVAETHPARLRIRSVLSSVLKQYGDPEDVTADSLDAVRIRPAPSLPPPRDTAATRPPGAN